MIRVVNFLRSADPFLVSLLGVVALASVVPVRGTATALMSLLTNAAIALLFFLHGAKLSRAAILQGIGNWRLHSLTMASTYVLFPAVGLAVAWLAHDWLNPLLRSGLLFLTLLPATVQSSIAFTAIAGGNVSAAVCSASLSNLTGIFITPVLVGLFMQAGNDTPGLSVHSIETIALQLLAPFLAGHLLRPVIGRFIDSHKRLLMPVDRGSILLVVYSAFSAAVVNGIWVRVNWLDMAELVCLSSVILAIVMSVNIAVARALRLPREDRIVLLFCGSKKSLVSGVPIAGALFPAPQVGLIILPLMIFHQVQLIVCAALAARYSRQAEQSNAPFKTRPLPQVEPRR